ncbi:hypothetical protein C8Q78DRAFT_1067505 [Trametes maxima]|nr:hypothetical protein C8Q78DRAFT_1067505 [Trametes maxima]
MRRENQEGIDEYCKLAITRNRTQPSFKNKRAFFRKVDKLPAGPEWICDLVNMAGDVIGPNGEPLSEELELWRSDPVECIRELIGNPAFKEHMSYAPVKVTRDGIHYYGEMNTADWWWNKQGTLPPGATIAPWITASDKTQLTVLRGDQTAWPVYLTIGNIDKAIRRKPSAHATVLIGYIPVSKGLCFSKATRSEAGYGLFHSCMAKIFHPLIEAGKIGVEMLCADGAVRRVYPILAAYVADHPEQCLIACCKENRCPRCIVPRKNRGDNRKFPLRDHEKTAAILRRLGEGRSASAAYSKQGLRPVYKPFWADLPHTDIFACITLDILHQLHKGVVKDHLPVWCQKIVGKEALDECFAALSKAHGLRHFRHGISKISQWTGSEAKEVEKVLLGLLVGRVSSQALKAIRGLLDFVYYAQQHFDIPKLHSLVHYIEAIRRLGCLDGVNTESSERLHIDYAKKAYRSSSRKDYISQMALWLQRQEAVVRQDAYLGWIGGELQRELERDKTAFLEADNLDLHDLGQHEDDAGDTPEDRDGFALPDEVKALRELVNSNVSRAYSIPLTPSARRVNLDSLIAHYGAIAFLDEINEYLRDNYPTATQLTAHSIQLEVFHSVAVLLPANIHFSNEKRLCKLIAAPAKPRTNDRKPVPARFDCALFVQDDELFNSEGGLEGLRAGQVKVIFRLPWWMGVDEHLVYVHWFCPFRTSDPVTGLASTSHSTHAQQRNASIMRMGDILRPCHLMPKFGTTTLNPEWQADNILNEPITFLLNRYLDFHLFHSLAT